MAGRLRAHRLGFWICLAGCATVLALILAPQLVFLVNLLLAAWAPEVVIQLGRHLAFEVGLWGMGLAAYSSGRRLGWIATRLGAITLVATPALSESLLLLALGRLSGQLSTPLGLGCRLGVGLVAIAVLFWMRDRH